MYNHAPERYKCPMCQLADGSEEELTKQADIIYKIQHITSFVAAKFLPNNPGHLVIVPNEHFENLYDISDELLSEVHVFAKKAAIALKKVYSCDGVSIHQHNEPSGNQDMWHFHVHVFPRYENDELYATMKQFRWSQPEERTEFVKKLKAYFAQ